MLAFFLIIGLVVVGFYVDFWAAGLWEAANPTDGAESHPTPGDQAHATNRMPRVIVGMGKPLSPDEIDPVVSSSMQSVNGVTTVERRRKSGLVEVEVERSEDSPQEPVKGPVYSEDPESVPGQGTLEERFPPAPAVGAAHQGGDRGQAPERRVAPSMAWVGGKLGGGTGFLVRDGLVATTSRAIAFDFARDLKVWFPAADGEARGPFPVAVVGFDPQRDMALLAVHRGGRALPPPFAFPAVDELPRGGAVGTLMKVKDAGSPRSVGALTVRFVPRVETPARAAALAQTLKTAEAGGPVIDAEGRALGMVTQADGPGRPALFHLVEGQDNFLGMHAGDGAQEFQFAQNLHRIGVLFRRTLMKATLYLSAANAKVECRRSGDQTVRVGGVTYQLDDYLDRVTRLVQELGDRMREERMRLREIRSDVGELPSPREFGRVDELLNEVFTLFGIGGREPGEYFDRLSAFKGGVLLRALDLLSRLGIDAPGGFGAALEGRVSVDPGAFREEMARWIQ